MSEGIHFANHPNQGAGSTASLLFCAALAVGLHAGMLFAWKYQPQETGLIQVLGDSVEVALVESASAVQEPPPEEAPAPAVPQPVPPRPEPPPTPPPVQQSPPKPAPVPDAPAPVRVPDPVPPPKEDSPPPPPREAAPQIPKTKPPVAATKAPQSGKPADGTPTKGATTGTVGDSLGKLLGKPLYLVRPQVNYPSESRAAGEQGVVLLRITVNAGGRPTAVNVANSSDFSRLDRAAVEGGWRCRVSNAFEGAQFEAPLRFSLRDR